MESQLISEAVKLKNVQRCLENTHEMILEHILPIDPYLKCLMRRITEERTKECSKVHNEVLNIIEPLQKIKLGINSHKNGDLEHLRTDMVLLQENTYILKSELKGKLECYKEQQNLLEEEVEEYKKRKYLWCNVITSIGDKENYIHPPTNEESQNFHDFVAKTNGHENGWSTNDHTIFLKVRKKHNSPENIAEALHKILPDLSIEVIKNHEIWYQEYMKLKEKHRESVKDWKMKSQRQSPPKVTSRKNNNNELKSPKKKKISPKSPKPDIKIKSKIEAWKEEKKERAMLERQLKEMLEIKQKNQEMIKRLKNEQQKQRILKWKEDKKAISDIMERKRIEDEARDRECKAIRANFLIKRFQSQDRHIIEKRKNCSKAGNTQPSAQIQSFNVEANRDPNRILQPTKQWLARSKKSKQVQDENYVCNLKLIRKLGKPRWRESL